LSFVSVSGGASDINSLSDGVTNSGGATVGLGTGALAADDGSANNNTALGYQALNDATTAERNVAVGYQAMDSMTTSYGYSTAVGYQALGGATTGFGHVAIGYQALLSPTGGENNTAVGREAGKNATGQASVFIGYEAGDSATGSNSVFIGMRAARNGPATTTAVGYYALEVATGTGNTAIGGEALNDTTTGYDNTALGYQAGDIITTGYKNTTLGNLSAGGLTIGHSNTILGAVSGKNIATGNHNVAVGVDALAGAPNMSGSYNIGIGQDTQEKVSTGSYNIALGSEALRYNTTGANNIAIGQYAYGANAAGTTGSENTAVGFQAMYIAGNASYCTALGHGALLRVTGNNNTAVGTDAGNTTTSGTNNTFLGFDAEGSSATVSNEITLGNASITSFRIPGVDFYISSGNVGIGTSSPSYLTHLYSTSAEPKLVIEDASSGAGRGGVITGTWGGNGIRLDSLGAAGWVYVGGSNTSYIPFTIGTEKARFHSNGNFGIGTTSPDFLLDVAGRIGILEGTNGIAFHDGAGSVSAGVRADSGDNLVFATGSSDTERMRITSSGNVGIGTSSPGTPLHVEGAVAGNNLAVRVNNTDTSGYSTIQMGGTDAGIYRNGSAQTSYGGASSLNLITVGAHPIAFSTSNTPRVTIDSSGNVGIGTTTANQKLTVGGSSSGTVAVQVTNSTAGTAFSDGMQMFINDTAGGLNMRENYPLQFYVNGSERMRITSSGNVGIGTTSPAKQFEITKSARATITSLTDGATITPDFDAAQNFAVTLGGNRTLANPSNIDPGQTGSIFVVQDVTGGRTLSFGSYWKFAGGTAPTLSTGTSATDRIDYVVQTSTAIHAVASLNLS
jgi:hypothetical protein